MYLFCLSDVQCADFTLVLMLFLPIIQVILEKGGGGMCVPHPVFKISNVAVISKPLPCRHGVSYSNKFRVKP
jgi:hypothetical protein